MSDKSLRERDEHITQNWYIACLTRELGQKPLQRVLYEKPYVIWRGSDGIPVAMPDRCLHRHTTLSMGGEVKNSKLVCPYHGWQYDQTGQVIHIPSEGPNSQVERKLCLKALPCVEQDGAIWIWTGDESPQSVLPPWRFPKYNERGWVNYFMITDFKGEVTDLAENFMDVPHTVFVHKGWFRDQKNQKVPMTVESKEGTVLCTYHQQSDEFSWFAKWLLNPSGKPMKHTDKFIYPNLTCVDYWFGNNAFIINSQISPVGKLKSRVYTYISYRLPFLGSLLRPVIGFYTRQVIEQDVRIMQNQGSSLEFDNQRSYRSTSADELHVQIERLRHFGQKNDPRVFTFETKKTVEFWI